MAVKGSQLIARLAQWPDPARLGPCLLQALLRLTWRYGHRLWLHVANLLQPTIQQHSKLYLQTGPHEPLLPGNADIGATLLQGQFSAYGVSRTSSEPWLLRATLPAGWMRQIDDFSWLDHLAATSNPAARDHARTLAAGWLTAHPIDQAASLSQSAMGPWVISVAAARLERLLIHGPWLCQLAPTDDAAPDTVQTPGFCVGLTKALLAHRTYLAWAAMCAQDQGERLIAAILLAQWQACIYPENPGLSGANLQLLDGGRTPLHRPVLGRNLARLLAWQLLADGCHASRNPDRHFQLFSHLVMLRHQQQRIGHPLDPTLQTALDRMAPVVRFFRHDDGGFILCNGGGRLASPLVDQLLQAAGADGQAPIQLPHGGYQRLHHGPSQLWVDTGPRPASGFAGAAHYSPAAIEWDWQQERIFIHCGHSPFTEGHWQHVLQSSAAHSMLTIDQQNASCSPDLLLPPGISQPISAIRDQDDSGASQILVTHYGYWQAYGLVHQRRIFMSDDGQSLRGEDKIFPIDRTLPPSGLRQGRPPRVIIRFHLAPNIQIGTLRDPQQLLLRSAHGVGFRFLCQGAELATQESITFWDNPSGRQTRQITLTHSLVGEDCTIRWAISQI